MPNTKAITSATSNILLVGDSGTHKTFFIGGCPKPFVFDFDKGMSILRHQDVEYETFKDLPRGVKETPTDRANGLYEFGTAWPAFIRRLNEIGALIDKKEWPFLTMALDSLTFLQEIAMNRILIDTKQDQPHQGSYGAQQNYIKAVLGQLTAWPIRLVCTAHIQRDTNDITKNTEKIPLVTGKLAGFVSAFFDEVYFCEPGDIPNKFVVKSTQSKEMRQAKSRWGVPDGTELSFAALGKYYGPSTSKAS